MDGPGDAGLIENSAGISRDRDGLVLPKESAQLYVPRAIR